MNEVPSTRLIVNKSHDLHDNYGFGWSCVWDPSGPAKNQPSSSLFGTMYWRLMSGMLRLLRLPSPPNNAIASPIILNPLNMNFGIEHEIGFVLS